MKKKVSFIKRLKRAMLLCSGLLFCGFLYVAYSELAPTLSSRPGRALSWSAGAVFSPLFGAVPWWFWGVGLGVLLYLWFKHKLLMSIILGVLAGVGLAL